MKKIITVDDLDRQADPDSETIAEVTTVLALGDRRVELDLTHDHAKELDELLALYFAAGSPPPDAPRKAVPAAVPAGTGNNLHGRQPTSYNAGMRRFADARKISYRTPAGSPYYSKALRAQYEQFLRSGGQI